MSTTTTHSAQTSIVTSKTLLDRLKDCEDQAGWQEFYNRYHQLIYSFALKAGLTVSEAEEALQETVIGVARKLPEFRYDPAKCAFKTWLLNQAVWRIRDQFRKRPAVRLVELRSDSSASPCAEETVQDPSEHNLESVWEKEWHLAVLHAAFERVTAYANQRDCQMFDLHVLRGLEPKEAARLLGVSVPRIYLAKHRIGKLVQREVTELKHKL